MRKNAYPDPVDKENPYGCSKTVSQQGLQDEASGAVAALVTQLQLRQTERDGLIAAIGAVDAVAQVTVDRQAVEQQVLAQVEKWRALLTTSSVQDGRQLLREVLAGPLAFTPEGQAYRFEGDVTTRPLIAGLVGLPPKLASPTRHDRLYFEGPLEE
jgi:hypothetical protein